MNSGGLTGPDGFTRLAEKVDIAERIGARAVELATERDAALARIARAERLIDSWERDAPDHSNPVFIGRLRETLRHECLGCGHIHTPNGCSGPQTPSDRWAGVSPATCDCNDDGPTPDPDPIRCATRCSQWPTCRHDWSPWRCQVCEAVVTEGQYCEDHSADEDTGPVVVEEIAWSRPCPAPLRCADQEYCPPACRRAGNREGNKAGSAREYGGCPGCECGQHDWLDRPESDTRECLICGTEVAG